MPLDAFVLALGSAFLHAVWNLILGRERDPEAATAIGDYRAALAEAVADASNEIVVGIDGRDELAATMQLTRIPGLARRGATHRGFKYEVR